MRKRKQKNHLELVIYQSTRDAWVYWDHQQISTKYLQHKNPKKVCEGASTALKRWEPALDLQVSHSSLSKSPALVTCLSSQPRDSCSCFLSCMKSSQDFNNLRVPPISHFYTVTGFCSFYSFQVLGCLSRNSPPLIFCPPSTVPHSPGSAHLCQCTEQGVTQTAYSDWCWQKLNLDYLFNSSHYFKRLQPKIKLVPFEVGWGEGCCFASTKDNLIVFNLEYM